jgi:glycosyltransferase involved in cell wall biosynthesis
MQAVYGNLRLVFESKQGAGAARNAGIRSALGKFITFLDADDLLTTDALQTLHDAATIAQVDVVTSSLIMFDEQGFGPAVPFRFSEQLTIANRMTYSSQQSVWTAILSDFGPCAKLYRRRWLLDKDIWFPETGNFEDNAFVIDVYMTADRIAVISPPVYLYRRYKSRSGRTQSTDRSVASLYDQMTVVEEIISKYNLTRPGMLQSAVYDSVLSKLANELARFGPDLQRKWRDLHNMHGTLMDVVTERFPDLKRMMRVPS